MGNKVPREKDTETWKGGPFHGRAGRKRMQQAHREIMDTPTSCPTVWMSAATAWSTGAKDMPFGGW